MHLDRQQLTTLLWLFTPVWTIQWQWCTIHVLSWKQTCTTRIKIKNSVQSMSIIRKRRYFKTSDNISAFILSVYIQPRYRSPLFEVITNTEPWTCKSSQQSEWRGRCPLSISLWFSRGFGKTCRFGCVAVVLEVEVLEDCPQQDSLKLQNKAWKLSKQLTEQEKIDVYPHKSVT